MALIDAECTNEECGWTGEIYRRAADWPSTPCCPTCASATVQIHLPRVLTAPPPVVVFLAPDGTYRFPGEGDGLSARKYASMGYERREIRGAVEMRRFEQQVNAHEDARARRRTEVSAEQREHRQSITRGELRQRMQSMSRKGRDIARAAMAYTDRQTSNTTKPTGFHSEVYSYDRSNREPSRDRQGRRTRD